MAQIIIDSGGSKSDWAIVDNNGNVKVISTAGLNPAYTKIIPALEAIIQSHPELHQHINNIHFYGAGCSNEELSSSVETGFSTFFPKSKVLVYNDVLAACKALCQDTPGIIGILGTGSNSAYYNGSKIEKMTPSGGFILGDEGSGFAIGRELLRRYMRSELERSDEQVIHEHIGYSKEDFISWVYDAEKPNKTVSSVAQILPKCTDPLRKTILQDVFSDFVNKKLLLLHEMHPGKIHFTGSVAFHYKEELIEVLNSFSLQVGKVIKKPISELVKYHLNEEEEN